MSESVPIVVNGSPRELAAAPPSSLLFALRDELGLTGAKPGCGEGECGACTVLLDGTPVRACQVRVGDAAGHAIRTVEGLAVDGGLHPVQLAFLEVGAFQCGYCTAGMIMSTFALLEEDADPDDGRIRAALQGNLCRCCAYPRIIRAVGRAAELGRAAEPARAAAPTVGDALPPGIGPGSPAEPTPGGVAAWPAVRPRVPWDLARPEERDWFAVLPEGLVVVHEPAPDESAGWTTSAGAWLHVGTDGIATAFTGKVDVGQDNRTALSLLVAEELRLPLSAVRLVMGDTDLCPRDQGTFGSRSMPDAGELLRRAAAGARECLVDLAERRGMDAGMLVADEGAVRGSRAGPPVPYAELVRGLHHVEHVGGGAPLTRGPGEQVVGRAARRVSGPEIVTGARRYPSDLSRPGMLHGRVLRAPARGAAVRSVDVTAAAALPGVTVVREGSFIGVVAPDPFAAGRALGAIAVDWERSPQPSEADLGAYLRAHPVVEEEGWGGAFRHVVGDLEGALADASTTLAATYTTAYVAHVPLETHVALAEWGGDGRLTVWTGTQVPFGVRQGLAEAFGVPEAHVRVIVPDTGGGFGGKHAGTVAAEAARLARAAGRPVKVRWSRAEEFTEGYFRPAGVIDVRSGARGGAITAWEMSNANSGMFGLVGPYEVPHQRLEFQPSDSPLQQGSYRALAATANHFARESHMDELAHALGVDPLQLRLDHLRDDRLAAVLRAAAERIEWGRPREGGAGLGIACGAEKGARVATAVEVQVGADRRLEIRLVVTAFECGAIVNPDGLANQVEGALVMGLGAAFFEAIRFEAGTVLNASLAAYRVPRVGDVPPIEVVLLDRRDLPSAGAGETPIIAIAPSLANAIFAATGVRLRALPLVPDGIVPT